MRQTWSRQVPEPGGFVFVALRQNAGIWLPKEQRLPRWGDAETQHLSAPPSFLDPGTAVLVPAFSLPSAHPSQGAALRAWPAALFSPGPACCLLFSPSLPVCWGWGVGGWFEVWVIEGAGPEI